MPVSRTLYANTDFPLHVVFDGGKAHRYTVNGEVWPGVTSADKALDFGKSDAFAWWSANLYRDYLYLNWPVDPGTGQPRYVAPSEAVALIEEGRKQHAAKKQAAADIGTEVHRWIEAHIKASLSFGDDPPTPSGEQARNSVLAFLELEQSRRVIYHGTEVMVASREHRYIGTMDAACALAEVDGVLTVEDHKTSDALRLSFRPQLAAYAMAWNEEHPEQQAWRRQVNLLSKVDGKPTVVDLCYPGETDEESTRYDFEAFLRALWLTGWGKKAKDQLDKVVKEKYVPPVAWAKGINA